jgi:hypothetical protein
MATKRTRSDESTADTRVKEALRAFKHVESVDLCGTQMSLRRLCAAFDYRNGFFAQLLKGTDAAIQHMANREELLMLGDTPQARMEAVTVALVEALKTGTTDGLSDLLSFAVALRFFALLAGSEIYWIESCQSAIEELEFLWSTNLVQPEIDEMVDTLGTFMDMVGDYINSGAIAKVLNALVATEADPAFAELAEFLDEVGDDGVPTVEDFEFLWTAVEE